MKSDKREEKLLSTARSRLQMAISAYSESREDEIDDLKFYAGSPDNHWQWPADVLATRGAVQGQTINARPCLTMNKLRIFAMSSKCNHVTTSKVLIPQGNLTNEF